MSTIKRHKKRMKSFYGFRWLAALLWVMAHGVLGETSLVVDELVPTASNAGRGSVRLTLNTSEVSDAPTALQLDLKFDRTRVSLNGVSLEGDDSGYDLQFRVLSSGFARVVVSSPRLQEIASGTSFRVDMSTISGKAFDSLQPFEVSGVNVVENQSGSSVTTRVNKVRLKGTSLESLGLVALGEGGGAVSEVVQVLAIDEPTGSVILGTGFQSGRKRYALGVPAGSGMLGVNPKTKDPLAEVRVGFNGKEPEVKPSGGSGWSIPVEGLSGVTVKVMLEGYETTYEMRMVGLDSGLEVVRMEAGEGEGSLAGTDGVRFVGSTSASTVGLKISPRDSRSTMRVRVEGGGWQALPLQTRFEVPLVFGDNFVDVLVTAENGIATTLNTVRVTRYSVQFGNTTEVDALAGTAMVRAGLVATGGARIAESGVLYSQKPEGLGFDAEGKIPLGAEKTVTTVVKGEVSLRLKGLADGTWYARPYLRTEAGEYFYGAQKEFVSKDAAAANQLATFGVVGKRLSPEFSRTLRSYALLDDLSFQEDKISIYASGATPYADQSFTVTNNGGVGSSFTSASLQSVDLKVGTNTIKVKVGTSGEYTLTVVRKEVNGLTADAVGTWEGILNRGEDLSSPVGLGGLLKITSLKSGKCTVRLKLGGDSYTWTGSAKMESVGRAALKAIIRRPRLTPLVIDLQFGVAEMEDSMGLTGSLSEMKDSEQNVLASFVGAKQTWMSGTGVQNFSIARPDSAYSSDEGMVPFGWGFGSFKRTGSTVSYAISLSDGTALTGSSGLLEGARVAVFSAAYKTTGSVLGVVDLQDGERPLSGNFSWFKRKQSGVNRGYGAGFGPFNVALEGGEYTVPGRASNMFGKQQVSECFMVASPAFEGSARLSPANQLTFDPGFLGAYGVSRFTSRFAPKDGLVSGGFDVVDPETKVKRAARFSGMFIPGAEKRFRGYVLIPALPGPLRGQILSYDSVIEFTE
jgi:hypothetical protein